MTFPTLTKAPIRTLQINLGRRCNLTCSHCHVEASPKRTEELLPEVLRDLVALVQRFPQIETVDLTGGAPEMHAGFRELAIAARQSDKAVIVRSNLTIYFVPGYGDLPEFCAEHRLRIVASLPCYLAENVDAMRGDGVFEESIQALGWLNRLGYGTDPHLVLDLVYNPPLPSQREQFRLPPPQANLEAAYREYLGQHFGIKFNHLLTIANLPIGRSHHHLHRLGLAEDYSAFLQEQFNPTTLPHLMCRPQLSVDYQGNLYDCDFNQMAGIPARDRQGKTLTVANVLQSGDLDLIEHIQTADFCYGCAAGSGSSCGGALVS
ncbi:MAG: radical SAM/Cys-rich domain protein [Oscillatoriales cyanobacterium SM2_2_1]|nr:radical SAM/Cys-rich domain protein [Oscillatoriales cyanobacterium SM2_2_1]